MVFDYVSLKLWFIFVCYYLKRRSRKVICYQTPEMKPAHNKKIIIFCCNFCGALFTLVVYDLFMSDLSLSCRNQRFSPTSVEKEKQKTEKIDNLSFEKKLCQILTYLLSFYSLLAFQTGQIILLVQDIITLAKVFVNIHC